MPLAPTAPILFLGTLLWVLFPIMQLAAEIKLFERRFISRDAAFSDCIGTPTTPICALDTLEACMLRRLPRLCELVMEEGEGVLIHPRYLVRGGR